MRCHESLLLIDASHRKGTWANLACAFFGTISSRFLGVLAWGEFQWRPRWLGLGCGRIPSCIPLVP